MTKKLISSLFLLLLALGAGFYIYKSGPFKLGLDLSGGSHLIYNADLTGVTDQGDAMEALRDVIERRVNVFGVSEPVVQVQGGDLSSRFTSGGEYQLIVDLPGVTDVEEAKKMIGKTPLLEFKTEGKIDLSNVGEDGKVVIDADSFYKATELTGRYLKRAVLEFDQTTRAPSVLLQFDDTGAKLFEQITKENVGKTVAIFLDGTSISNPVVCQDRHPSCMDGISGGEALISGGFTNPDEARELVRNLNYGALPVPITEASTTTIGATLGENALQSGVRAGAAGFLLVALFLILWYRLPGLVAALALSFFVILMLALFKLIPVTLTAAGIAGFIISIGIAVDANVLVFERMKEELLAGKSIKDSIRTGFSRAWLSIRDSNLSNIIVALILFWFGTSLIKGFALTLGLGVIVSMFSAITVTRVFLSVLESVGEGKTARFLFGSGLRK